MTKQKNITEVEENDGYQDSTQTNCTQESDQVQLRPPPPPHDWDYTNIYRIICKRCKEEKTKHVEKLETTEIIDLFLKNGEVNLRNIIDNEIEKQSPCLTDDEAIIKDIIE